MIKYLSFVALTINEIGYILNNYNRKYPRIIKHKSGEFMDINNIEQTVGKISRSVNKGDVIATYSESTPIDFDMDLLKSIEDINRFAIGLRIFKDGKVGNSYMNSLDDTDFMLKSAEESSAFGDEIDIDLPAQPGAENQNSGLTFYYPEVITYPKEKGLELGFTILKNLKSIDSKAKVSVSISKSCSRNILANTSGFFGKYEETHFGLSASMILVDDDGGLLYVGDGDTSYSLDIDLDTIYKNIEWRYKYAQTKVNVKSGYYPVLFSPEAMDLILEPIEIAANSKTLYKGISVLSDKLNNKICSEKFSMIDNPLYAGGLGSYPFDDEGVLPEKLTIIENGIFKNYIYDLTMAKRLGKKSTGHGNRGVASLPSPSFSNLIISTGNSNLEQMIESIDYGLIVYEFLGGGMSNVLAGDFSVNVELGYLVEKGKVTGRVKNTMLSGNAFELLNSIRMIENRIHKKGSLYAPHILFERVSATG